jgi:hypothetical protein
LLNLLLFSLHHLFILFPEMTAETWEKFTAT